MKKSFKLENLGCANCAAKMENDIAKLEGVQSAKINYMTSKLILEADDEVFADRLEDAQKIAHKYEPDCQILK